MVKLMVAFFLMTTPSLSGGLDFLKNELEPLSFEKFLFKNSLKGPIIMNLKKIKEINKQVCEDSFSACLQMSLHANFYLWHLIR